MCVARVRMCAQAVRQGMVDEAHAAREQEAAEKARRWAAEDKARTRHWAAEDKAEARRLAAGAEACRVTVKEEVKAEDNDTYTCPWTDW